MSWCIMKKKSISSKLSKVRGKWKFFILLIVLIIILILPSMVVTKYSTIKGSLICRKIETTELTCKFVCSIHPENPKNTTKELYGRVIVFHSLWTAMFDKTYRMQSSNTNLFDIELPRRNYEYSIVVSMYDDESNIGVSDKIKLVC